MSNLRIIGIIIGILGLLSTFMIYRGPNWKRSNFALFTFFNLCLIAVSVNPDILNSVRDILSLQETSRGRILALLVLSNIFLLFYSLFEKTKIENLKIQFDRLVRYIGVKDLDDKIFMADKIKPLTVIIPAYNEAENLKELLPRITKNISGIEVGVIIIDDGSEDETSSIADGLENIFVLKNPINRGGGAALRLGYDIIKTAGGEYCVTMDADGQHRPEEIESLIRPLINDQFDFVIGSRILGKREQDSFLRFIGVILFGRLVSLLLGKKITDPSSGFRAFRMSALSSINLYEDQYHTSELIIEAVKKGLRIGEMPITILKRRFGKSKKGNNWAYGFHFAKIIIKTWWR